ncbi:TetR family transcriptional regulator [Plantibacter sp. H53]|nr:TetR family transcriptional regulator [Plantibacter flavus]OAN33000.1 TetR family transcriptional regulator [Plantibacter sp. H53]OII40196.1 TetR family transcriptional regulator [Plantibacter sp. MMLR14_011]
MTSVKTGNKPQGKPRGAYAKTGMKRVAILDAALAVFANGGYRAGSLREVAAQVGMSEAGLLHHFPNKSALLAAVLSHRDDLSATLVPMDGDDPIETLRGLVALARYNASVPGVVALYCTLSAEATSPDHPAHDYFVERYEGTRARLERTFGLLVSAGRVRAGFPTTSAAFMTLALMDGLQVQWLLAPESVDMADELHAFLSGLLGTEL